MADESAEFEEDEEEKEASGATPASLSSSIN